MWNQNRLVPHCGTKQDCGNKLVLQCGTKPQCIYRLVPQCGIETDWFYIVELNKVVETYWFHNVEPLSRPRKSVHTIYHQLSIVWTDFLGRENGSTMWNHYVDPESQSIHIPSTLYSIDWLSGSGKRFHNVEPLCRPRKSVYTYIYHQLSIVYNDSMGFEYSSAMWNHCPSQSWFHIQVQHWCL